MFDGAHHPQPFLPSAAPPGSANKSVGIKVYLDSRGHVSKAIVSKSSGSALLDEGARSWAQYEWLYSSSAKPRVEDHILIFSPVGADERNDVREARSIFPDAPRPPYPYLARRLHKEGTVELALRIGTNGTVQDAVLTKSSGFRLLDLMTQQWVTRYWKLQEFSGKKVRGVVIFTLKGVPY